MKKQDKKVHIIIFCMFLTVIILLGGGFAFEMGQKGKAICLIMGSLYLTIWVQAIIIGDVLKTKLEEIKEEIGKNHAVEKSPSTNEVNE